MTIVLCPTQHFQGASHIAPDPDTAKRDLAVQLREIQTDLNLATAALDTITTPIAAAADFPLLTVIEPGQIYRVTVACTDNAGATHTNTGQAFIAGDEIIWNGTDWTLLGHGPSVVVPAAIGVAAAGTNADKSNSDHVHAHGNQLGGTLHADVVAGVSAGFMTAVQATNLAAIVDDHVNCVCAAINPKTDESEVSAALTGDVAKHFMPTHIAIEVTAAAGALNADCTINVGTAADGAQIASALACTGLTTAGAIRLHPIPVNTFTILGNATLYANVEAPETGAGTATYKVTIIGRQF